MEEIQTAISSGDINAVKKYYADHSGLAGEEGCLLLDDAILLATVYKQHEIVHLLMSIKYENPVDVISNAAVGYVVRHPRIQWDATLASKLARKTSDVSEIESVINSLSSDDQITVVNNSGNDGRLLSGLVREYISHGHNIWHLISRANDETIVAEVINQALYTMPVNILRKTARLIGDKGYSVSLLKKVMSCRDFGAKWPIRLYGKIKGWDDEYITRT